MLDFFRALTRSRIGAGVGLAFLIVIVLSFAGADLTGMGTGSLIGGENVASVGSSRITTGELQKTLRNAFDSERQRTPTLTIKDFVASGALDEVLTSLIERDATWEWGRKNGMGVSERLIDSEIAKLPAFQGADGKFSQDIYRQFLAQRGLNDAMVRRDIGKGLLSRMIFAGAAEGATMPTALSQTFAGLLLEKRSGTLQYLPATAFAPKAAPTDQQIGEFYRANIARYQRPEQRTVRYTVIDDSKLKTVPAPGEADIRKRYQANAELYASGETRSITQVILPTEAAAKAFAAELASGKAIDAAASAKGLAPAKIADKSHDQLATDTSKAVADAVFAAGQGKTIAPTKGALGWVVARVDTVSHKTGKTLDQARPEIITALAAEKRKAALGELATQIGEKIEGGTSLPDVAKAYGLTVVTTDPLQADGTVPGKPGAKAPADVQPLLQTLFSMEREGQPQIGALPGGEHFILFDVGRITPGAPAALAEIKTQVAADWTQQKGSEAAANAADKVLAAIARKVPFGDAFKSLGITLPPVTPLAITRAQMAQMQSKVPAPLAMLFAMSPGMAKKVAAPGNAGWAVVMLNTIEPGTITADNPLVQQAQSDLGKATAREYEEQLRTAITREVGSKRNQTAIDSVRTNLVGSQ